VLVAQVRPEVSGWRPGVLVLLMPARQKAVRDRVLPRARRVPRQWAVVRTEAQWPAAAPGLMPAPRVSLRVDQAREARAALPEWPELQSPRRLTRTFGSSAS